MTLITFKPKIGLLIFSTILVLSGLPALQAAPPIDSSVLTIDRIFNSNEFRQEFGAPIQWIDDGEAYLTFERTDRGSDVVHYQTRTQERSVFIPAEKLVPEGESQPLSIAELTISPDDKKVMIFTNTRRVWRSNTKGDFWVYDLAGQSLKKLGASFPEASLSFAKFSPDNRYAAYVHAFNLYQEDLQTGEVIQLTFDGTDNIINGTFDWVYEEEFGCRDGFRWSPDAQHLAFWQLDASSIGTFYMINNIDSVYSKIIPVQYPKVGENPSACKIGYIHLPTKQIDWIPIPGEERENYLPRMQWIDEDRLLIQQLNRKQNTLKVWTYQLSTRQLKNIYTEKEETWVDIDYPDPTANNWGMEDLPLVDNGAAFLRMSENDDWRHVYKISLFDGRKTVLTPGNYDVASSYGNDGKLLYFSASPTNSTQRYLYQVSLDGKGDTVRLTPAGFSGLNRYNLSPNGKYAVHAHSSTSEPRTVRMISLPDHQLISNVVKNERFKQKLQTIKLPEIEFFTVTTEDGIEIDGRMIKPVDFDPSKKYPVLFHVYGEPWGQVAIDTWISMWNILLAQKGYLIIDMDNRGTPCLKGSAWRKSIYRKIGVLNSRDQAMAAKEVLKWNFTDPERTAIWGWSGGGSMTLNLLFRYPNIYKTGMSVAPVTNQLYYDNIYQERYMGLPSENMEDFVEGSPITYAKNLQGNLLLVHGTADDNVHYQNSEALINELIRYNKKFRMMAYPNRSHGIYEGQNTRRHLYTLLTDYLLRHTPPEGR